MKRNVAITGFGVLLLVILGMTLVFYRNFRTVIVSGNSMEPTFKSGQRLLASQAYWLVGNIREKDIVVVRSPIRDEYFIKRVYKLEGQVVDYQNVPGSWSLRKDGEFVVPKGHIYVLGDNREVSEDSREYGAVPIDRVIGKVIRW